LANITTADFGYVSDTGNNFNQFDVTFGGVDINVAGWSDTKNVASPNDPTDLDSYIERAVDFDKNGHGWSMLNVDELNSGNCGYSHSADNLGNCDYQDYDFFLLSFSESVSLTKATYSWVYNTSSNNQVSVVALNSAGLATDTNGNGNLQDNNWSDIATNQTLASDWAQVEYDGAQNHNYYTDFGGTSVGQASNVDEIYSNFWLIGALNTVFGGNIGMESDDGMKLAGVSFKTKPDDTISVPEPSTFVLLVLALMGLQLSNRRQLK
jgi:hypothetical protein